MNEELKRYLEAMENRLHTRIQGVEDRTAALIAAEIGALHSEMREGFDRVDRRLDLQGLMLSTSTKALGGLLENTVSLETEYKQTRKEIGELRGRIEKLEGGAGKGSIIPMPLALVQPLDIWSDRRGEIRTPFSSREPIAPFDYSKRWSN